MPETNDDQFAIDVQSAVEKMMSERIGSYMPVPFCVGPGCEPKPSISIDDLVKKDIDAALEVVRIANATGEGLQETLNKFISEAFTDEVIIKMVSDKIKNYQPDEKV